MVTKAKSTKKKTKSTSRLTIRLTSCDAMTLRRLTKLDKTNPSALVRDMLRTAGDGLDIIDSIAHVTGKPRHAIAAELKDAGVRAVRARMAELQVEAAELQVEAPTQEVG